MIVSNQSAYGYLIASPRRRRLNGFGDFWSDAAAVAGGLLGGILGTNKSQPQTVPQYPPPPPPPNYTTPALILGGTALAGIVLFELLK